MSERKPDIGTKLYYSIGEVAELTELPPYTLRSWEKEFPWLRPKRVRGKNRAYRPRDIGIVLLIKRLLHEERYSTMGALQKLRNEPELIQGAAQALVGEGGPNRPPRPDARPPAKGHESPEVGGAGEVPSSALRREVLVELRQIAGLLG